MWVGGGMCERGKGGMYGRGKGGTCGRGRAGRRYRRGCVKGERECKVKN